MIKNKQESDLLLAHLGLNRMLEKIFTKDNIWELPEFLENQPYKYYNIRDKSNLCGAFFYKVPKETVLDQAPNYERFSVYETLALADNFLIIQGELQLNSDFTMITCLSSVKGISNRLAMQEPQYTLNLDLREHREPNIDGLTEVIDYIATHGLIGMIVEFSLFGVPVGMKQEPLIIWELRNY